MNYFTKCLINMMLLLATTNLAAQNFLNNSSSDLLSTIRSPMFGTDIVMQNEPSQDQRLIAVTSAFNGWLYAVYGYRSDDHAAFTIQRSIDDGATWTVLLSGPIIAKPTEFIDLDILVPGNSLSDMKIVLAGIYRVIGNLLGRVFVSCYNAQTGTPIKNLLQEMDCYHVALTSGTPNTSDSPGPFSFGVLYSKLYYSTGDSVIFVSSSNGGESLDHYQAVAHAPWPFRFHDVSLAYGSRTNGGSGQYFAAWEHFANMDATRGHIYTSRSVPDLAGAFTVPKNLDSLDLSIVNQCRNPRIACQYGDMVNDSANLTALVLCDRYNTATAGYDILGFCNRQAADHDYFTKFNLTAGPGTECNADIAFNPYDSTFMVTYFDSTQLKLPFLVNEFNLANPGSWSMITTAYNDNSNLLSPFPKVACDPLRHSGVNAWISEGPGGNGIALFDAPYHVYTGMDMEPGNNEKGLACHVWPNPANGILNIKFDLDREERVILSLKDMTGCRIKIIADRTFPKGRQHLTANLSDLPSGGYFVTIRTGSLIQALKVFKVN